MITKRKIIVNEGLRSLIAEKISDHINTKMVEEFDYELKQKHFIGNTNELDKLIFEFMERWKAEITSSLYKIFEGKRKVTLGPMLAKAIKKKIAHKTHLYTPEFEPYFKCELFVNGPESWLPIEIAVCDYMNNKGSAIQQSLLDFFKIK